MLRFTSAAIAAAVALATSAVEAQTAADSASVKAFYDDWFGSAMQGPERYASFYAPDGAILPPNARPVRGRADIARWMRESRASMPFNVQPDSIIVNEIRFLDLQWVLHQGTLFGRRVPKAGGDPKPFETKYVDLLHRNAAGKWEVAYRMWSDNR